MGFETGHRSYKKTNRRRCELSIQDLLSIISFWKAHNPRLIDLASHYKISAALAARIIRQYKTDPDFLVGLSLRESRQEEKIKLIGRTVESMMEKRQHIWTMS